MWFIRRLKNAVSRQACEKNEQKAWLEGVKLRASSLNSAKNTLAKQCAWALKNPSSQETGSRKTPFWVEMGVTDIQRARSTICTKITQACGEYQHKISLNFIPLWFLLSAACPAMRSECRARGLEQFTLIPLNFGVIHGGMSLLLFWGWSPAEPILNVGDPPHRSCRAILVWGTCILKLLWSWFFLWEDAHLCQFLFFPTFPWSPALSPCLKYPQGCGCFVSFISEGSSAYKARNRRDWGRKKKKPHPTPQSPTMQKERSDTAASASTSFLAVNEFFVSGRETVPDLSLQRAAHPLQKGDPAGSDLQSSFNPPQAQPEISPQAPSAVQII